MKGTTSRGVPDPMAGLSPSPAGHNYADDELAWGQQSLSPVPSPLEASRTNNEAGLRQSASSPRESAQHVCFAPRDSLSGNPLAASKPSSNSLASNPSHASFASTQTESSVGLTPDNITFGYSSHSAVASTGHPHASAVGPDAFGTSPSRTSRRIKRLERNRESARLSRKRRKAYLEELEAKVHMLSGRMDRERVAFAWERSDGVTGPAAWMQTAAECSGRLERGSSTIFTILSAMVMQTTNSGINVQHEFHTLFGSYTPFNINTYRVLSLVKNPNLFFGS
jgi:hypothetical protein